jgi:hypothetical protein
MNFQNLIAPSFIYFSTHIFSKDGGYLVDRNYFFLSEINARQREMSTNHAFSSNLSPFGNRLNLGK